MKNCKVTLETLKTVEEQATGYSRHGLKSLFGTTKVRPVLTMDRTNVIRGFSAAKNKMSISGAQPKRTVVVESGEIILTDTGGQYILKPSPEEYEHLAEVEHTCMTLAAQLGSRLAVAKCGLCEFKSGELVYITKRFDRTAEGKIGQEQMDAAMGLPDKYDENVSYERIGLFIGKKSQVPLPSLIAYFEQVIICYLIGNNDLHIRNIGLLVDDHGNVVGLTPAYDIVAAGLYIKDPFLALPLTIEDEVDQKGSTAGMDVFGYYTGKDFIKLGTGIGLSLKLAKTTLEAILKKKQIALELIDVSYMPADLKIALKDLIEERALMLSK